MNKAHSIREKGISLLSGIALILTFLLPLKFGSIAAIPEIPLMYPDSLLAWTIITWPNGLFACATSLLLLFTVIAAPCQFKFNHSLIIAFSWSALSLISIIGIISASTMDFAFMQVTHLLGIASYALVVCILIKNRPDIKRWFIVVIVVSTLLTCFWGFHQFFAGFEETRHFVYQQELKSGITHSGKFYTRLHDTRVFSTFSLSNSFAAHLILTIPLCLWFFWTISGNIEPPKVTRAIILPIIALVLFATLYFTISRAAVLSLGLAILITFWLLPFPKSLKIASTLPAIIITILGILLVNSGRSFASIDVRLDYFYVALKAFLEKPLTGAGWGDFFHEYTKLKLLPTDEAPHTPHNMILAFASQVGILGLLGSLIVISYPTCCLIYWSRKKHTRTHFSSNYSQVKAILEDIRTPILIGWLAWTIHALADINIQIPATVSIAILLTYLYMPDVTLLKPPPLTHKVLYLSILLFALATFSAGFLVTKGEYSYYQLHTLCDPRFKDPRDFAKVDIYKMQNYLEKCKKSIPYSPFPYTIASDFAMYQRMPQLAEAYMKEAIKRSPDRASFYWKLGMIQLYLRKTQDAEKSFINAKRLFPNNPKYSKIVLPEDKQK